MFDPWAKKTHNGHVVVYFAADEEDISVQDAQYTDILLACTRHLLRELKDANPDPILDWLKGRLKGLQNVMSREINIDTLNLELALKEFAKITAAVRTQPGQRQKIREQIQGFIDGLEFHVHFFGQEEGEGGGMC